MSREQIVEFWKNTGLVTDLEVIRAFLSVSRELFVPKNMRHYAYEDCALPIAAGQTISQPTTVAIITQALSLEAGSRVLEVGAGSGYQSAIISAVIGESGRVFATEIINELADLARENLQKAGVFNVEVVLADGSCGLKKAAPFDRIVVSAACPKVPKQLLAQLSSYGVLVAPVDYGFGQKLVRLVKSGSKVTAEELGDFSFVPLKGKFGKK